MSENKEVLKTTAETVSEADAAEEKVQKASTAANRARKAERREAKAARKEANKIEEKKSRPNNLLLAILIFGVLIGMFAFVKGYTYYKLEPSIQSYIKNNGGKDAYGSMMIDQHTTAAVTAKKNDMKIAITCTPHDEDEAKEYTDYYKGEDGEKQMKYIGAYMLTTMKPECRGFSASVTVTAKVNDEKANSVKMTYREAKKYLKELEEENEEENADASEEHEHAEDEADADAAADTDTAADADAAAETSETGTEDSAKAE